MANIRTFEVKMQVVISDEGEANAPHYVTRLADVDISYVKDMIEDAFGEAYDRNREDQTGPEYGVGITSIMETR